MAWLLEFGYLQELPEAERRAMWLKLEKDVPEIHETRNITRKAIESNEVTKTAYSRLCAAGLTSTEQFELLVGFISSTRGARFDWRVGLYRTRKSLAALPKRLKDIGSDIRVLNRHDLIDPYTWMKTRDVPEWVAESFSRLPDLLQLYADYLESQGKFLTRSNRSPGGQLLDSLLTLVRSETKRAMYAEISQILTTTAGLGSSEHKDFSPDSLKIRWQRLNKSA